MKILVTGGAGFIGSHTVDALLERGHEVRILDNLQKPVHLKGRPSWIPDEAEFVLGDVRDKAMWERCLDGVETVYHFAAYQDYLPDFSTFFHVNAVSTALLYEVAVAKRVSLQKVVVASSQFVQGEGLYRCRSADYADYADGGGLTQRRKGAKNLRRLEGEKVSKDRCGVFAGVMRGEEQLKRGDWEMRCPVCGEPAEWMWTPETHAAPPNAYAMAKYSQEMQAMSFGGRYAIPSVALRYSIVQGPRQSFYNAYSGACRIFSLNYYFGKAPTVYEDGKQCRDFVNIHDVVRANLMALEDGRMDGGVFNVGGGKAYTVWEFAEIVRKVSADFAEKSCLTQRRKDAKGLPEAEAPGWYRFGDTRHACSDISKIRALGWEPEKTPEDSVREYVEWLHEQDNVENILAYAEKTMKEMNVVRSSD